MSSGPNTTPDGRIQPRAPQNGAAPQPGGPAQPPGQGPAAQPSQVPARREDKPLTLAQQIERPEFMLALRGALPQHIRAEKMARIALTALRTTKDLAQCTPESFFGALMQAAQLGLEVNTPNGHAWLIPRRNQGRLEATLQVGYQGMIELALRSGKVEKIWARVVREGDHFQVKYGLEEDIVHEPSLDADRDDRPITYVYAVAKLTTGGVVFEPLSISQVEARRARSPAGRSGPWQTDYEAMVRKTAVRALYKFLPKSSEMARAAEIDERQEYGKPQAGAYDETVHRAIVNMGLQPIDTTAENIDPQTGEVLSQPEPGANG